MNSPIVAYMSVDGRLMTAEKRDKTNRSSVANRYSRALVELTEARAAVAELVEAAKAINVAITCGGHEARINRSNPLSVETLRAALAKFGGAA